MSASQGAGKNTSQGAGGDTSQGAGGEKSSGGIKGDAAVTAFWYARKNSASVRDATKVSEDAAVAVDEFYKKRDAGEPIANAMAGAWNKAKKENVMVAAMEGVKLISGNHINKLNKNLEAKNLEEELAATRQEIDKLLKHFSNYKEELTDEEKEILTRLQAVKAKADAAYMQNALGMEMENVAAAEATIKQMTPDANEIWAAIQKAKKTPEEFCTPLRF